MKKTIFVITLGLLGACSSPKYTASFNNYDTNTGYHVTKNAVVEKSAVTSAVAIQPSELTASVSSTPAPMAPQASDVAKAKAELKKVYQGMSKQERKEFRKEIKSLVKAQKSNKSNMSVNSTKATKAIDHDLKLAAIFGAIGIVALIIGGNVFWVIGGIALIIGVVFFVLWLVRQ